MSVITSFVNVIAGASVLLGGKAFMDEKITNDGPSIRKVVGVPLLGVGALGILVSYVRNKRVREDKKAENDFYEAELYEADAEEYKHCDACEEVRSVGEFSLSNDPEQTLTEGEVCDYCFGDFYEAELYDAEEFEARWVRPKQGKRKHEQVGYSWPVNHKAVRESARLHHKRRQRDAKSLNAETPIPLPKDEEGDICDGCDKEGEFQTWAYNHGAFCKECIGRINRENADPTLHTETFDAESGITFADVPRETLGGTNNNPVRIIVGGPPHSGKSTLMNLIEDKMNQYGVSVELRDLDFSAPTDLKGGFDQDREKIDWTPELAEEAATYFDEDSTNRVILGDSIGLISRINEIVSEPADVAILLVSGSQGDDDRTYREAIKKWMQYYDDIDKPVLMVIRSSMNPEDMNYFDPHDNYGVIVGLDRNAYNQGGDSNEISLENACLEGIVFEIAQEFDLGLANRSTRRHIDIVEESWPSIRGKPTWNPIDAGKPHLARIEDDYFEELKRRKMGE